MAKTEEYLSQSKYAEHRNVTKGYIGRMVKEGRLHLIKGKLNVEMSDAELDIFVYNFVALKILNPKQKALELEHKKQDDELKWHVRNMIGIPAHCCDACGERYGSLTERGQGQRPREERSKNFEGSDVMHCFNK